jgi:hypothetical protein
VASAIGYVLSLLLGLISQPASGPSAKALENQAAEFPPYDNLAWYYYSKGAHAQLASDLLARAPDSVETLQLLLRADRLEDALALLRRIVERHPYRIADAFEVVSYAGRGFYPDEGRGYAEELQRIVRTARLRLSGLPREAAARAARQILHSDTDVGKTDGGYAAAIRSFVREYSGTEAALLAEVEVIRDDRDQTRRMEALERFASAHAGTVVGAKALYTLGEQWPSGPPESDPTDRFIRVFEIFRDLTSGKYPPCEWVERARWLVNVYIPEKATIPEENIDRILDIYTRYVKTNFVLEGTDPASAGIGYIVTTKMAELFRLKAGRDDPAGMDRLFEELQGAADPAAVRYLQALYYMKSMDHDPDGAQWFSKARDSLAGLYPEGAGLYHRKALATLASLYFHQGDLTGLYTHQSHLRSRRPAAGVASDVAEIRTLLFRPTGDGVFDGQGSWEQSWPAEPPRFMIVDPDVSVKTANGDVIRLHAPQSFSVGGSVLFMDAEQIALLTRTIDKLGGTARSQADSIMAVPQPAGASRKVLELWAKFFPTKPGHWGGWHFYTFPILYQIEFLDDARTKAIVPFRIGYQGATVVLEKTGGTWRATRMTSRWIE